MNYINFERKYVSNGIAGSIDTICLWKHQNGSVCEIDQYMTPNYVYMRFENGITVSITMEGSNFKIALDDDILEKLKAIIKSWMSYHLDVGKLKSEDLIF